MENRESDPGGINIASRIKQFSSSKLDTNSNYTNEKPNPAPRRRPQTQEVGCNIKDIVVSKPIQNRKCVNRSTSSPVRPKKPLIPVKPVTPKPVSPKPRTKPRAVSACEPNNNDIHSSNKVNGNDKDIVSKRTSAEKPKLPTKPANILNSDGSKLSSPANIQSKKSWKQTAGPPRKPVPAGPSVKIKQSKTTANFNPPKPLRGIQIMEAYENNDLNPANRIKNNPNHESRRGTLDGQLILGAAPESPASSEDESYNYTYERQLFPPSTKSSVNQNSRNEYDQCDPVALKDFMSTIPANDNDTDELYQDPDEFASPPPPPPHSNHHHNRKDSFDSSEDDDLYEDPNCEDFHQSPIKKPVSHYDDDDIYDCPPQSDDEEDYEEPPPDARYPVHTKVQSSSEDEENYDFPDTEPPPVPRHNVGQQLPPVPSHNAKNNGTAESLPAVPSHKNSSGDGMLNQSTIHSENNLNSSSSDEDDDRDYTDPEMFFTKPPIPNCKDSNRMGSMRRGSNMQPSDYMPVSEIVPVFEEDDELLNDTLYIDPATALSTKLPTFGEKCTHDNDDFDDDDEDIYSDEPLYQVYRQEVNAAYQRESKKKDEESINKELVDDLVTLRKGSTMRILWSELPSVRDSGFLDSLSETKRKRQEAMFEMVTSEASYLKSLDILVSHFMLCKQFLPNPNLPAVDGAEQFQMLDRQQYHFLFSGLSAIKGVSERFLRDLRRRQQSSVLIDSISDIILDYAENHFQCYVKYCSNQVFQDRTFQALLHSNPAFVEKLLELEKDPITQGLSLQSFLTLPMQRICRLPLLVDAICSRCEPGSDEFQRTDAALKAVNKVVHDSNEGTRKMERTEEMYFIQKNLTWKTKPIPLISSSRWLVKKGDVMCLHEEGRFSKYKNHLRQMFKGKCKAIYIFLFTDIVLVTKMKSDEHFKVIDVCQRSLLKVEVLPNIPDPEPSKVGSLATINVNPLKYAFTLILLENTNNRTVDYHCFLPTETDKTRWLEAFNPPSVKQASVEGESIYESWDCPQVQVIHPYTAQQSDELTLLDGDIIHVLRKLPDGWAEGMRMRDDEKGWFPINHTDEIDSRHMRAKNLMQRYRLITASKQIVNDILGK